MPQPNDAEFTALYSASTGLDIEDNEPNSPAAGGTPSLTFDLQSELVAGNAIGSSGATYILTLTAIDDTLAAEESTMSLVFNQKFDAVDGWIASGPAGNFSKKQKDVIQVPTTARGHVFHYEGRLVSTNNDVVSFIKSKPFILLV